MRRSNFPDFTPARGRRLLAAVSGGADSAALLHMLSEVREPLGLTLSAAHIDHGIRGAESRADAEFCRELCLRLGIPFHLRTLNVPQAARESGEGLETAARRLRYAALREIRGETGSEWIVLAHHLDDQAETVLMHLLRGCGPDGIGGMEMLSGDLYRPLLNLPKQALTEYLTERGLTWREDATNRDDFTPRNALRLHGLPALEKSYPRAADALCRYAEAARCENRFMDKLTGEFLAEHLQSGAYGRRLLSPETADEAVLRRALRRICGPALPADKLVELTGLCRRPRGRLEISGNLTAERTPAAVYFLPKEPALPPPEQPLREGKNRFGQLGVLDVRPGAAVPIRDNPFRQALNRAAVENAVLRTRAEGDRIRPLGGGDRLLSDYLTDRKIDRPLRDTIPLIAVGNRILWVVGVGISEEARLTGSSDSALILEWRPESDEDSGCTASDTPSSPSEE